LICYFLWSGRSISQPNGILAPEEPQQELVPANERRPIKMKDRVIEPLAHYKIHARILSTEQYWFDYGSAISPIDLALGWGPMSDTRLLKEMDISQGNRFYYLSWSKTPSIPAKEIMSHSANVHIIPANAYIKKTIGALRVGQVVELQGDLVMVSDHNGGEWKSSLSRDDTGNGACELMLVTSVRDF